MLKFCYKSKNISHCQITYCKEYKMYDCLGRFCLQYACMYPNIKFIACFSPTIFPLKSVKFYSPENTKRLHIPHSYPHQWFLCLTATAILYIHGSVHRDSLLIRSNKMQQYAGIYLLQVYSTCFMCTLHPSSGVHENVTAASGTGLIRPCWRKVVAMLRKTCTRGCTYSFVYS